MTIIELLRSFGTEERCIQYIEQVRWAGNPVCPYCNAERPNKDKRADGRYLCISCNKAYRATQGTIFHSTRIPLQKWFMAINLLTNAKKGISSYEVARECDTTHQSAWYMIMRIRKAMNSSEGTLLKGIVEMDETYVGGKPRNPNKKQSTYDMSEAEYQAHKARVKPKAVILGAVERKGQVKASKVQDASLSSIAGFVCKHIKRTPDTTLITDEYKGYKSMDAYFKHKVIKHADRYVKGEVHTNTIENFWSIFKRSIHGIYYHLSHKHMNAYLNEFAYRYNRRKQTRSHVFYDILNRMIKH